LPLGRPAVAADFPALLLWPGRIGCAHPPAWITSRQL
jgi:hypothetical protein